MVLASQLCFLAYGAGKSCMWCDSTELSLKQYLKKRLEVENKVIAHLMEITLSKQIQWEVNEFWLRKKPPNPRSLDHKETVPRSHLKRPQYLSLPFSGCDCLLLTEYTSHKESYILQGEFSDLRNIYLLHKTLHPSFHHHKNVAKLNYNVWWVSKNRLGGERGRSRKIVC